MRIEEGEGTKGAAKAEKEETKKGPGAQRTLFVVVAVRKRNTRTNGCKHEVTGKTG